MTHQFLTLPDRRIAYAQQTGTAGRAGVFFLGGYASDMTGTKASFLAESCAESNISFTRFDYSGHGASDGDFKEGTIGHWLEDAMAVFDLLTKEPQILVGSSMGGWIGLLLALRRPEKVKAFVGVAAAPDFTEDLMWEQFTPEQRAALQRDGFITDPAAPPDHAPPITLKLIEEARRHLLLRGKIDVRCPVRLLQGMKDAEVPWGWAARIVQALTGDDARVVLVKNGDHRLSTESDLRLLVRQIMDVA